MWPNNLAAKIISGYIGQKFDILPSDLRRFDPPMGALPFFNNSATDPIRRAELTLVAGGMIKFLAELQIPFEPDMDAESALTGLVEVMSDEMLPSARIVGVIDEHYKFRDEA